VISPSFKFRKKNLFEGEGIVDAVRHTRTGTPSRRRDVSDAGGR